MHHDPFGASRDGHHRYLDQSVGQRQRRRHDDRRPRRRILGPVRAIHLVHRREITHISQVHHDAGGVGQAGPGRLQGRGDVVQHLLGLRLDISLDDLGGCRGECGERARHIDQPVGLDRRAEREPRSGREHLSGRTLRKSHGDDRRDECEGCEHAHDGTSKPRHSIRSRTRRGDADRAARCDRARRLQPPGARRHPLADIAGRTVRGTSIRA